MAEAAQPDLPPGFKPTALGPLPEEWELVLLREAEEERAAADRELDEVLAGLGLRIE